MINKLIKKVIFKIILYLSNNSIRVFIYKHYFKYDIGANVKIGKSVINCKKVTLEDDVIIGDANFISCRSLTLLNKSRILSHNTIIGGSNLKMGENSRIIYNHKIDLANEVSIGENSWLAGDYSQIWTHGSLKTKLGKDLSVNIGNNVYLGSGVLIAPGVKINSNNLVGLGSVVLSSIKEQSCVVSGNPAKIVKENVNWRENW
ncbi:transferase hexapeptide (six repeat-containing protein) [Psychroflexus salarius]|uniref:Transferase hexapeptide (Six repeat-containing protein) n=1 Tax=Psychroflexus salarius TaxID=1155689 RepID=A0A1M4X3E9_9FLAO|nr:hypothetical protein [Psychroflexus salarius]SHE88054.1 transferase hexapeptide (six repeat-containing protein) [Psychroflexus salarius]